MHEEYMRQALALAQEAAAHGEVPVGCVIVREGRIVGRGRNRREEKQHTSSHAEMEAIRQANEALGTWRLDDCTLYVTLEPCPMCAGAILNARIRRVVEPLIDGTFSDGGTGMFRELYDSLTIGASWHRPDQYYLLLDFLPYCDAKRQANRDYAQRAAFTRKCLLNTAGAGVFSSDRTILEYANEIWRVKPEDH